MSSMAWTQSISRGRCCNSWFKKCLRKDPAPEQKAYGPSSDPQSTNTLVVLTRPDFSGRAKRFPNQDVAPVPALLPRLGDSSGHLFSRRVRHRPGLNTTCTGAVRTYRIHAIAFITICFHCGRGLRRAQDLSFARTVLALPYAFTLSIVWALNVRMLSEADLTAMRTTAGTWFHTLPVLRVIETNLEPIPVGLEHTFRPFPLGVRGWRPFEGRHTRGLLQSCVTVAALRLLLRLPLLALDVGSPPTAVTVCSNARAASMGIPAT